MSSFSEKNHHIQLIFDRVVGDVLLVHIALLGITIRLMIFLWPVLNCRDGWLSPYVMNT